MSEYLKSVGIVNFLNHKELLIEFHPGFNVIAGDSDTGKSAILRDISWVTKNEPSGDAIRNWDAKKSDPVVSELIFQERDGSESSVTKERKGSTSSYTLSTLPDPLDVVGNDVPQEALELINFSDLNFKGQHDPYLLSITGGKLAKKINELVGLSDIDLSLKNLTSKTNATKKECDRLAEEVKNDKKEIDKMSYLEQLDLDISAIEEIEYYATSINAKSSALKKIVEEIDIVISEIEFNEEILNAVPKVDEVKILIDKEKELAARITQVSSLVTSIESLTWKIKDEEHILGVEIPFQEIKQSLDDLKEKDDRIAKVQSAVKIIENLQSQLDRIDKEIETKENNFASFLVDAKVCPTCMRELNTNTICKMVKK